MPKLTFGCAKDNVCRCGPPRRARHGGRRPSNPGAAGRSPTDLLTDPRECDIVQADAC